MVERSWNLRPIQDAVLKVFVAYSQICERHGFHYYAAFGTALGAMRHHGFIPWDDDFDVAMPRKDYNEFVKVVRSELPSNLRFARGGESFLSPIFFSRIFDATEGMTEKLGRAANIDLWFPPFIDIFILDGIPERVTDLNKWSRERRLWRLCQLWRYPASGYGSKNIIRGMGARLLGFLLNTRYRKTADNEDMMRVFDELSARQESSTHVVEPVFFRMQESRILSRSLFEPSRLVPFEDVQIRVAYKVEEILKRYYGDYMKYPPEKDQVPPHIFRHSYEGHV